MGRGGGRSTITAVEVVQKVKELPDYQSSLDGGDIRWLIRDDVHPGKVLSWLCVAHTFLKSKKKKMNDENKEKERKEKRKEKRTRIVHDNGNLVLFFKVLEIGAPLSNERRDNVCGHTKVVRLVLGLCIWYQNF